MDRRRVRLQRGGPFGEWVEEALRKVPERDGERRLATAQSAKERHNKGELLGTVKGVTMEEPPGEAEVDGAARGRDGGWRIRSSSLWQQAPAEETRRKMLERLMAIRLIYGRGPTGGVLLFWSGESMKMFVPVVEPNSSSFWYIENGTNNKRSSKH